MEAVMKFTKFLLLALALMVAAPMFAQSGVMKANIPFEFSVENHQMPSGSYIFKPLSPNTLLIQTEDGSTMQVTLTETVGGGNEYKAPVVIFEKDGEDYYLATAWFGNEDIGREFATSHGQARLQKLAINTFPSK
jgi:hypothetical protein